MRHARLRLSTALPTALALLLGLGWATREAAFAREKADTVASQTVNLSQLKMAPHLDNGKQAGLAALYMSGDTPNSRNFVTGRFIIDGGKGKTPHAPHVHPEEEVMIIESGEAEIFCDGKTTKVGPGSAMYTTPNAPHGIVNLTDKPVVFYFIKWDSKAAK